MGIINFTAPEAGNFLVKIIIWLVSTSSSIAVGIIVFTLILKLITLPFDYFSRASMRKNTLKMEQMRPELEKLQKQYADNKELYNQKMMALYKKNGYSMFGACLPTILTLVIFIVAINAFTNYSQYQNKQYFYNMSTAYNRVVYEGLDADGTYIIRNEDGSLTVAKETLYQNAKDNGDTFTDNGVTAKIDGYYLVITTDNGYVEIREKFNVGEKVNFELTEYKVLDTISEKAYANRANDFNGGLLVDGKTFSESGLTADEFIGKIQSAMSAKAYHAEEKSFLWIKNIWVTDSPMKHPVETDWDTFKQTHAYKGDDITDANYKKLIGDLEEETTAPNGYFVLVILTAGLSLLQQLVMTKSQKASMELQTVDGQGAQTQKMMTWMMPIMMAVFAFMYTSAFSIYIIISTVFSMLTTFGINFIVDRKFKKEETNNADGEKVRGRVYIPKEEKKVEKKKEKKKNETPTNDFLSGTADNKKSHIRGRLR
ncbi:MAG: membrane protein insertase YidC [Clostridiales bacterium]|nr:membrane protein insertase YidC [Clostridiales bacterium]